jgi:hypothetical protein
MANNQDEQGGFPQKKTGGQSTHSTTGDGHPPRPGEEGYTGGGSQSGNAGQKETGGTGGYGGTSDASGQ